MPFVAPIVEGHGEVEAVPALLHRIARHVAFQGLLRINPPIRVKQGSFINDDAYFDRQIRLAAAKAAQENGSVLILLDCEDACPAKLGPDLLRKAKAVRGDVDMFVALAYREFETWFIAAAASLRGYFGLPSDLETSVDFESIRDAKGWLSERMDVAYDPVTHQLALVRRFDLDAACASRSFGRLFRRVNGLLGGG